MLAPDTIVRRFAEKSQKKCQTTKTCNLATGWLGEPLWLCVITLRLFCYFQIDMVSAKPSHETFTYVLYLFVNLCQLFASNYTKSVQNRGKLAVKMPQQVNRFCVFAAKLPLERAVGKNPNSKTRFRHPRINLDCGGIDVVFFYRHCPACETHLCTCLQSTSPHFTCKQISLLSCA